MRDPIRSVFSETIERSLCPVSFCLTLFMYRNYPKFQGEVGAHQSTPRRNYNSKSQMRKFRRVRDEELAGGRSAHSVLTQNEYKVGSLFRSSGSKVQRKKVQGFRRLLCTRHTGRDSTQTTTNSMSILKNGDRKRREVRFIFCKKQAATDVLEVQDSRRDPERRHSTRLRILTS